MVFWRELSLFLWRDRGRESIAKAGEAALGDAIESVSHTIACQFAATSYRTVGHLCNPCML